MAAIIRAYADTSVYGGVFDEEFSEPSRLFFDQARGRPFQLVVSTLVAEELRAAPQRVRTLFEELRDCAQMVTVDEEAVRVQRAYLQAAVLSSRWRADALHVALATVSQCRLIVSWNFKHIVNFKKIPIYNGVNLALGYGMLSIHTPQEVTALEDQDI